MPITIRSTQYYRTAEACEFAGISKNTFFRWLRAGEFEDARTVDRHGWRLFTENDVERLFSRAQQVSVQEIVASV